ncbi:MULTISPECIES: protoporphyrinogen oxidase [Halorussus]|uniref:protoporphyrinogen oxidase n=1 Tax=Halorussus TaxID=1070314 RepID=UPI000E2123F0|nr:MULTISPECIES: protoporphyrinogen oxidase [Halorussus]NHN61544.1 protoporphyrinogen oxidase [Halorussus sp. JP-T4]
MSGRADELQADEDLGRVGIVGGGITGLSLAHYLAERGVEFTLFEAAPEPGGVVRSDRVDGHVVERGPQRVRRTERVDGLISDLDLEDEVRTADPDLPICVYAGGDLHPAPFSVEEFGETDLLSAEAKRAVLGEPFTDPADPEETAADMFTRKFGAETYRKLLGPLFGGIYGSDPAAMPVGHALSGLVALERRDGSLLKTAIKRTAGGRDQPPAISFDDGLGRLPEALAEAHVDSIRLGAPVTAVRRVGDGASPPYTLETPDGTAAFDRVVLTTPADLTADLVADVAPDSAAALRELNYNPLAMVYLRADVEAEGEVDPAALGYQVGFDEDLRTLGVSWNDSMFERGVYTAFLGGMHDPDVLDESEEKMGEIAAAEFEEVTGAPAEVADVNVLRRGFPAYDDSWDAVERVDLPDGVRLATNYTARMGVPSRLREAESVAEELAGELS